MQRSKKQEERIMTNRGKFLIIFCGILFFILFIRLVNLQLVDKEKFQTLRKNNVVKTSYLVPERGDIFDRTGKQIAGTRGMFSIVVVPEKIIGFRRGDKTEVAKEFIEDISELITLTEKQKKDVVQKIRRSPIFSEVVIKSDVTERELSAIAQNKKYLEAVDITSTRVRDYKNGSNYLNVLGYVGKVSPSDLKQEDRLLTNIDFVGKRGVEKLNDKELFGEHGKEIIGVNAYGKMVDREKVIEAKKGSSVSLTIDDDLQKMAYELLGDEKGAIVALDPNSGQVLAIASTPTYDPNKLVKGLSHEEYKEVFASNQSPFFDRAVSGQYPPASTIKPFVSIAGLLGDWIDPKQKIWCGPYYQLPGSTRRFNDWKKYGHGHIDMRESIEVSADVYYYKLGKEMGIDYIHDVMSYFGFGKKTGIALENERVGLLPSTEWKKRVKNEGWYTGETLIASIGQGFMMSTPMQLAQATAVLVNGGTSYKPTILIGEEKEVISKIDLPPEHIEIAKQGMRDVVFGDKGTARSWKRKIVRYDQGGKTGTSQVYSTNGVRPDKNVEMPKHLLDHALYIGFAPYNDPKIVVSVVIENVGGGSTYAAPVGIKMMQKYLDEYYPETIMEGKEVLLKEIENEK